MPYTKKNHKKPPTAKYNSVHCPKDMSPEDWQRALRRQAAHNEHFGIAAPVSPNDPFIVSSGKSGRKVKISQGTSSPEEMAQFATELFDSDGVLRDVACNPASFIRRPKEIEESYVWESDALAFVIENRDRIISKESA